ncbi:uncharacterized protein LOC106657906 [Trichogramma pretiosum]|uniref:uncharacterized protein LOC106657906 n=1 Tax=Trichogramma pretiosum TaxID=7493 RepID=UPI0006C9BD35|nr:uncharacterized protein LOC106657906 [Trichogramma pretiosum]
MASAKDTAVFFAQGTPAQFEYVLKLYPQALRCKAEGHKSRKAEELIKLDNWYQNELPKRIRSRGKDAHLVHDELVQCMKWKQTRGKFYPQLSYLVKVNTPRAVMAETKKAFKKLPNLEQAITALSNLKGVGTTMASALLAAASPEHAPFMADECLKAIPDIEGYDYTTKEYLNFVQHIQTVVDRLNQQNTNGTVWSPHSVELALWTHYIANEMKPELLTGIPDADAVPIGVNGNTENGTSTNGDQPSDDSNQASEVIPAEEKKETTDGKPAVATTNGNAAPVAALDENSTTTSFNEDSLDRTNSPNAPVVTENNVNNVVSEDTTNDSIATNDSSNSNPATTPRPTDEESEPTEGDDSQDNVSEPPTKKLKQ